MALRLGVGGLQSLKSVKTGPRNPFFANRLSAGNRGVSEAICLVIFMIFALANASHAGSSQTISPREVKKQDANEQKLKRASLRITGSMCPACLKRLCEKLKQLTGVSDATITPLPAKLAPANLRAEKHPHYRKALVEIDFDPLQIQPRQLVEAIKQNDFGAVIVSIRTYKPYTEPAPDG